MKFLRHVLWITK